jgi:hypothetical protein
VGETRLAGGPPGAGSAATEPDGARGCDGADAEGLPPGFWWTWATAAAAAAVWLRFGHATNFYRIYYAAAAVALGLALALTGLCTAVAFARRCAPRARPGAGVPGGPEEAAPPVE